VIFSISDSLDINEDDSLLDEIDSDMQSDWLIPTDSNYPCEDVSLSKENDVTEGKILYHTCVHIVNDKKLSFVVSQIFNKPQKFSLLILSTCLKQNCESFPYIIIKPNKP